MSASFVQRALRDAVDGVLGAAGRNAESRIEGVLPVEWTPERLDEVRARFLLELSRAPAAVNTKELLEILVALEDRSKHERRTTTAQPSIIDALASAGMVTAVAHDMRSPLTSILFLVDTILRRASGPLSAAQERQLRLVYSAAWGLSNLACDLVDSTHGHRLLDGGPAPFSITETMQNVRDIVHPIAEEKGVRVRIHPPRLDGRFGYATAVSRVLLNLASNALDHTDDGCVTIGSSEEHGDRIVLWVEDTGRGMSRAPDAERATAHGASRIQFSSRGLGLEICHKLLGAMGSQLNHERAETGGARFFFALHLPHA